MDSLDAMLDGYGRKEKNPAADLVIEFVNLAKRFTEDAESGGGNPAYAAGKAVTYFLAAKKLAKAVSPKSLDLPIFQKMEDRLTPLSIKHRVPVPEKTVVIQHRADPDRIMLEVKKSEREEEANKPNSNREIQSQVEAALVTLGFQKRDAMLRSIGRFEEGKTIEELIAKACQ